MGTDIDPAEARAFVRYTVVDPFSGSFGSAAVRILNVGDQGVLIEHAQPLRIRTVASLSFKHTAGYFRAQGEVLWSHLSSRMNEKGKLLYQSGIRIEEDSLRDLVGKLVAHQSLEPDPESMEKKRQRAARRNTTRRNA